MEENIKTSPTYHKSVVTWLVIGCVMIAIMVVIGGITRLTHSGLSITEWKPIVGAIPPTSEAEWLEEFEKYKQIPEFEAKHYWMELDDFKYIYFWEFIHRQWGRLMGIVFFIPFVFFLAKGKLKGKLLKQTLVILFLGRSRWSLGLVYGCQWS
jgi:heme a synthase